MKLKIVVIALLALVGLFLLNRKLNEKKTYISGVPAADKPMTGEVREEFTVGFLPVT